MVRLLPLYVPFDTETVGVPEYPDNCVFISIAGWLPERLISLAYVLEDDVSRNSLASAPCIDVPFGEGLDVCGETLCE